jgi:guanylate kinase
MQDLGGRAISIVPKATERPVDPDEDGDEIYHVDYLDPAKFNLRYEFQGTNYGLQTSLIWKNLERGLSQVLISNMGQFGRLRDEFGDLVVCVYLHATRTIEERLTHQVQKHGEEQGRERVRRLDDVHNDYIAQIADFQHVLLNTLEEEDLAEQMLALVEFYQSSAGTMIGTRVVTSE